MEAPDEILDPVSVFMIHGEGGAPDHWQVNVAGLLVIETGTIEGVLNFFDEYIPGLARSIEEAEEGLLRCRAIYADVCAMKLKVEAMVPPDDTLLIGAN